MALVDSRVGEGTAKLIRGTAQSAINVSKTHPTVPVGAVAYAAGVHNATQAHNLNAYGDTYNKGRAQNRHPGAW